MSSLVIRLFFFLAFDFPWSILLKFCARDLPVKGFLLGIFVGCMRSSVFCNVRNSGFLEMWILGICFMVRAVPFESQWLFYLSRVWSGLVEAGMKS